jgi:hypothetical protein
MKLASIASSCSLLVRTARFHWERAIDYSRLFNDCSTAGSIDLVYTPVQRFYERMANHHLCSYYRAKQLIQEFEILADYTLLSTEQGQNSGNGDEAGTEPFPIPGAGNWL